MKLVQKIEEKLLEARKSKNELAKNILSVALGDIQTQEARAGQKEMVDQQAEKIVQKIIKSNNETMEAAAKSGLQEVLKKLGTENEILIALLPKDCNREELAVFLNGHRVDIKAAKSDGQATGVAMKLLSSLEGSKDGKVVADIVKEMRSE